MALSTGQRNLVALTVLVAVFLLFQLGGDRYGPALFDRVPWAQSLVVFAVLLFLLGAASFFVFAGGFWTRTFLTATVPFFTQGILELTWKSDPAYPQLLLMLAVPYAVLFFLGAVFIGGPYLVWRDSRPRAI
jgi:hypothetical protein